MNRMICNLAKKFFMQVKENIKYLRKQKGLTQATLAER
jgi:DNA-binding XRE family transcriptional regulator